MNVSLINNKNCQLELHFRFNEYVIVTFELLIGEGI